MIRPLGVGLLLFLISFDCLAWSREGHRWIGSRAMANLNLEQQAYFQKRLTRGPWKVSNRKDVILLSAAASAWPDSDRDKSVATLFKRFGSGRVPQALTEFRQRNTNDWHYANRIFLRRGGQGVSTSGCQFRHSGRLFEVWPKLIEAYPDIDDPRDQALVLAYVMHLLGDAYQPLHTVSAEMGGCDHDRGGNGFCVDPFVGVFIKDCHLRLHKLWDDGFGQFTGSATAGLPLALFTGDSRSLQLIQTAIQPWYLAIYPKSEIDMRGPFEVSGQRAVRQLSEQAAVHLSTLLQQLFQLDHQSTEHP